MPWASWLVLLRIVFIYLVPIFMLGLVLQVPLDEKAAAGGISPFVAALDAAGIPIVPSIINALIMLAVFSMANASVFASSRALHAVCMRDMGPAIFKKIKWDRPIWALAVVFAVSFLTFLKAAPNGDAIFQWLLALAASANYFTWIAICLCHIRFRWAIRRQGLNPVGLVGWQAPLGIPGSVFAIVVFLFALAAQITAGFKSPLPNPPHPIVGILGTITFFTLWLGYKVFKREWKIMTPLEDIDLEVKPEVRETEALPYF
ncbi:amino acid permease/ SLC12A domain-containing protein [Whalleya microplaca]|nr:amino acid permease/ SLC12A domain-containing protein [Whalleya microplaca]